MNNTTLLKELAAEREKRRAAAAPEPASTPSDAGNTSSLGKRKYRVDVDLCDSDADEEDPDAAMARRLQQEEDALAPVIDDEAVARRLQHEEFAMAAGGMVAAPPGSDLWYTAMRQMEKRRRWTKRESKLTTACISAITLTMTSMARTALACTGHGEARCHAEAPMSHRNSVPAWHSTQTLPEIVLFTAV